MSETKYLHRKNSFKALLAGLALATAMGGVATPAFAGGGHHGDRHHYRHGNVYYGAPRYYRPAYGHRYRNYHRHRGGVSGGEAALIAAGIIGGIILIDRANDRRDAYARYDYYDRYDAPRQRGAWDDDYYYRRDGRVYDRRAEYQPRYDERYEDDYAQDDRRSEPAIEVDEDDYGLAGSPEDLRAPRVVTAGGDYPRQAFLECAAETRGAIGAGGMMSAFPDQPTEVETLADGTIRMTTLFTAQNERGQNFRRSMICEADDRGVALLEIG
jgi:hypothetical protein